MEQTLENTLLKINEYSEITRSNNLFEIINKFDDGYKSSTLEYYEKTINKYVNQNNSNELISFKMLKENQYNMHTLMKETIFFLEEMDITNDILDSLLLVKEDTVEEVKSIKEIITTEEDEVITEPEPEEKIKGFDQKAHYKEQKIKRMSDLIGDLKNNIILEKTKTKSVEIGYGVIFEDKVVTRDEIIILEDTKKTYEYKEVKNTTKIYKKKRIKILKEEISKKKFEMDMDFELLGLVEYIYLYKYDRLIKKEIYTQIKKRFFVGKNIYNPMQDMNLFDRLKNEAISFATEGFLIGIRKYSTLSKTKLITYVTWWIKQRIVYYIENFSSINKGKKTIHDEESFEIQKDEETGEIKFNKYANIQFENYNFIKSDDIAKYEELEKLQFSNDMFSRHDGKIYDILTFFCRHNEIFLPFEYLLIKYDILLEEYIYFIETAKDKEIKDCFYKQINEVNDILKSKGYKDLMDFDGIKEYYKLPETLMLYFNVEKKEYLTIKRILKQKLINILKNVFLEKKKRKKRGEK